MPTVTQYTPLTTREEMEFVYSLQGVETKIFHEAKCVRILNWFIQQATVRVLTYLKQRYDTTTLNVHPVPRGYATWIACYYLSQRSGNPSLFYSRYEETMDELQRISTGELPLLDANTSYDFVPSMSNMEHDPRYRDRTLRVDPETSTQQGGTRPQETSESGLPGVYY